MYVYKYTYKYMCIYTHMNIKEYMYMCVYEYTYIYQIVCIYNIHTYVSEAFTLVCILQTGKGIYTFTYIHIFTHI